MSKKIRTGIIGSGFVGLIHIEALRRLGYVDVAALAEIDEDRAKQKADQLSIPRAYGDWRDLIEDEEIEAVHICTANFLHFEMARQVLLAKKHVICEKPLGMNSKETSTLMNLAKKKECINAVGFNVRFYPLVQHMRAMIQRGELGDIFTVRGSYLQDWLFYDTDYNWRVDPELSGPSRAIADIGSHLFDLIQFVTTLKITEVLSDFGTIHPIRKKPLKATETYTKEKIEAVEYEEKRIGTEDYASVLFRFNNNNTKGVITVSQVDAGRKNQIFLEISGSKKTVCWNSEAPNELWIGYRDKPNELLMKGPNLIFPEAVEFANYPGGHNEGFPDTFKQLFRKVYECVKGNFKREEPQFPTFTDGHKEVVLCEGILKSSQEKQWVRIQY